MHPSLALRHELYNDVSLLSIDYPIYTVQGPSGGIFMAEGFDLIKDYLPDKFVIVLEKMTQRLNGEELETVEYILKKYQKPKRRNN